MLVLIEFNCGEDCFAWTAPFEDKQDLANWWNDQQEAPANPGLLRHVGIGSNITHTDDRMWALLAEDPRNPVLYLNGDLDSVLRLPTDSALKVLWVFHQENPHNDFETSIDCIPPSLELVDDITECREHMNVKIKEFLKNVPMET
jgi:hypothetical protein